MSGICQGLGDLIGSKY